MYKFYVTFILLFFVCNLFSEEIYNVDFNKPLKAWRIQLGKVAATPSGTKYCHLATEDVKKAARLFSPIIKIGNNKKIEISFKYKTTIKNSSLHLGTWIYISFMDIRGKSKGYHGEPLRYAETWTEKKFTVDIPKGTSRTYLQFRIQQKKGTADFKDIKIKLFENMAEIKKKSFDTFKLDGLKKIISYKLLKDNTGYKLNSNSENLSPVYLTSSSYPLSFVLPNKFCNNKALSYQLDITFVTNWDSRKNKNTQSVFTLGRNMSGAALSQSVSLTIWKGKTFYGRITPEFFRDKKQFIGFNMLFTPKIETKVSLRLNSAYIEEILNGKNLGKKQLQTAFMWPENRPFFIGAENKSTSIFRGEIKKFELSVFKKIVDFKFDNSFTSSYFYGSKLHQTAIHFPDDNSGDYKLDFKIQDIDGKTVAKNINAKLVSNSQLALSIPKFPYGWYSLSCTAIFKGEKVVKNKSFAIMPKKLERVAIKNSAYGFTQGFRPNAFKEIDKLFAISAKSGARWWRYWLCWEDIEPAPGKFQWEALDKTVELAQKHGLELYIILQGGKLPFQRAYKPTYTLMAPHQIFPSLDLWKRYLKKIAERYRGKIKYYQIYNEPDSRCGFYPFTAEKYVELLKASAETLRAVDKNIVIGLGGFCAALSGENLEKTTHKPTDSAIGGAEFYNLKPQKYFDIVDVHLYSVGNPGQFWDKHVAGVRKLNKFLARYGDAEKPVWNSETAFVSSKNPGTLAGWAVKSISEKDQASRVIQWYAQSFAVGIQRNFWYTVTGAGGIVYSDFTPKPSFISYSSTVRELKNMKYIGEDTEIKNLHAYNFAEKNLNKTVAWTLSGKKILTCSSDSGKVTVRDMWGNPVHIKKVSGYYIVKIGTEPIFIESVNAVKLKELVTFELSNTLIANQDFDLKFSLNNPTSIETEYSIFVATDEKVIAKRKYKVPPYSIKSGKIVLNLKTKQLLVETKSTGGIKENFFNEFNCNLKIPLTLANNQQETFFINKMKQVHMGKELIDDQARVMVKSLWKGTNDLSAKVSLKRSGDIIDFIIDVTDNHVMASSEGKPLFKGDCIELFFDFGESKKFMQILIAADGRVRAIRNSFPEAFNVNVAKTKNGYVAKGSFKLPELKNKQFGFDVALDDADTKNTRKVQMIWSGNDENYKSSKKYGLVVIK